MIETARLLVREWRDDDLAELARLNASPAVMQHLGGASGWDEAEGALDRVRASQAAHGFCFWALERKANGEFVGFCGLKVADEPGAAVDGDIEIGWRLAEHAWGQGLASEAAAACIAWAWRNLAAPRVFAATVAANRASWRVMERIGMTRRPDLDFVDSRHDVAGDPQREQIVYAIDRPVGG